MFRPIRRKKNELSPEESAGLLLSERRGVLAVHGDDGYPYAIPINYLYCKEENRIYFHGARVGHKADALKRNNKVCFTVYGHETAEQEAWAPFLRSVVVFGRCEWIQDRETALELVRRFARKYYPDDEEIEKEITASGNAVQMFAIEIEHMSGKQIQEK